MSYSGISIRETLDKLNASDSGWFLPEVQRQYVWGSRYDSETYVCLLMDSLLRRYPIGGIVLWETRSSIPHREFLKDYAYGRRNSIVDEGRWGNPKGLVYDGQQRLQTIYSVLRYRFNNRVLHYDILFDQESANSDETGFIFRDPHDASDPRYVRMTELSSLPCDDREKIILENRHLKKAKGVSDKEILIRTNISRLWGVFVDTTHKAIAYFPVRSNTPTEVNEIFTRLNTGGVALTELELLLGRIKSKHYDYEERLWSLAQSVEKLSGGISLDPSYFLQCFHLLIKRTMRIDADQAKNDTDAFNRIEGVCGGALKEVFCAYLFEIFNINHASIVPRWSAILPIAAYLMKLQENGKEYRIRRLSADNLEAINQYFILSQFCDWNTQTMVNAFTREVIQAAEDVRDFPFEQIRKIATDKNRTGELREIQLKSLPMLATKILMPNRSFVFHQNKPQLDHIFPVHLANTDDKYSETVDTLWNLQPTPAGINNYKRNKHPLAFFQSSDGAKYFDSYDFIPKLSDSHWGSHEEFIKWRKEQMILTLRNKYKVALVLEETDAS